MTCFLEQRLQKRRQNGNLRSLKHHVDLIDFTSFDYLGFARCPHMMQTMREKIEEQDAGTGSTGSRLLTGHNVYIDTLESEIAQFHGAESGLIYPTGYMANIGLLSAVAGPDDTIFYDIHVHASTRDGISLSKAKAFPFRHQDLNHLESRLSQSALKGRFFVCVESIYSMSGEQTPLREIAALCERYNALLIVDEAHATGIYGNLGQGLVSAQGLESTVFARTHTFGKALGVHGAIIIGSHKLREYLINFSRPFIYATAPPLSFYIAIKCAYERLKRSQSERQALQNLIAFFLVEGRKRDLPLSLSTSPIQPLAVPGNHRVKAVSEAIKEAGFDVRPIVSPTVKQGREILRLCLHSFNTTSDISKLLDTLQTELKT